MMQIARGLGLIELVVSQALLSVALVGTLLSINTAVLSSADPVLLEQAVSIAQAYLEEISHKAFPVTPCPSATRPNYSNICNYAGLSESPTDHDGNALSALGAYTVDVAVDTTSASLGGFSGAAAVARIDVSVSHAGMQTIHMSAYKTND